jgi:PKD repeat protein
VATLPILKTKAETQSPTIQDPTPGYWETSEYMIGKVAVGIILPESNGTIDPNTEDWTDAEIQKVLSETNTAFDWLASQNTNASVTFVTEVHMVSTRYESINHTQGEFLTLVIPDLMNSSGYENTDPQYQCRDYANDLRKRLKTDWAFIIFVVDSSNDSDGMFNGGGYAGSAYGGTYLIMTYDNRKDRCGIENMDRVCAHETCHTFYATDEYLLIPPTWGGYLNVSNIPHSGCLMDQSTWQLSGAPYGLNGTWGQIGWRDTDGDRIQDIVDTPQQVNINPPTRIGNAFNFTGVAAVTSYPNTSPWTRSPSGRRDVTVNIITNVTYRVDNGTWSNATVTPTTVRKLQKYPSTYIDKETFAIVNFNFLTAELSLGQHLVEVKATNQWNISGYANVTAVMPNPPKANFTFTPPNPTVNQPITFNASSSNGTIATYAWDFNDGNKTTVSQPLITHAYTNAGNYTVTLNVTDNQGLWNTTSALVKVTGIPTIHDVAITSINPYQTKVSNRTTTSINVTAVNQGDTAETFNVTLTYNSTVIRTETVTLNVQNSTTITFFWNTTGLPLGNYTVTTTASQVPGETDTADNTMIYSPIRVSIQGDINGDGKVDMKDVSYVARRFMCGPSDELWDPNGDIDENGVINMKDISTIAKEFGKVA